MNSGREAHTGRRGSEGKAEKTRILSFRHQGGRRFFLDASNLVQSHDSSNARNNAFRGG
jgi:hypothetical protein